MSHRLEENEKSVNKVVVLSADVRLVMAVSSDASEMVSEESEKKEADDERPKTSLEKRVLESRK